MRYILAVPYKQPGGRIKTLHCSLQSKILCRAVKDTVLDDQIFLLLPYGYVGLTIYKDFFCRVPFSFLCVLLVCFCNAQRSDRLNVEGQTQTMEGKGRALHHNIFFSDGFVRQ